MFGFSNNSSLISGTLFASASYLSSAYSLGQAMSAARQIQSDAGSQSADKVESLARSTSADTQLGQLNRSLDHISRVAKHTRDAKSITNDMIAALEVFQEKLQDPTMVETTVYLNAAGDVIEDEEAAASSYTIEEIDLDQVRRDFNEAFDKAHGALFSAKRSNELLRGAIYSLDVTSTRSSVHTVIGERFDLEDHDLGPGLDFESQDDVAATIGNVETALRKLKQLNSRFDTDKVIAEARHTFTKNQIDTLTTDVIDLEVELDESGAIDTAEWMRNRVSYGLITDLSLGYSNALQGLADEGAGVFGTGPVF